MHYLFLVTGCRLKEYRNEALSIVSMKDCAAEFIGTFIFLFARTGAILINEASSSAFAKE